MNILKERMKRIAVIGLAAAMITAQVPQGVYGTEAAAETVEVMQKDAPVVEETQKDVLVMEEAEVSGEEAVSDVHEEKAAEEETVGDVPSGDWTEWDSLDSLPSGSGSYILTRNVTITSTWVVDDSKSITLDLNGHKINQSSDDGSVIRIDSSDEAASLTIKDSSDGQKGCITGGKANEGGGVYVGSNGSFIMEGGSVAGNTADKGGGVYVDTRGTFTMKGGSISGNATNHNDPFYGGGGVYVNDGTFTMENSSITDNTTVAWGGGVFVDGGKFSINNGIISGNDAVYSGGGVFVDGGTISMNGGSITGNNASQGGGLSVINGTFTMEDSCITENIASFGGGVYVDRGTSTMENSSITGNIASFGGGVLIDGGEYTMNGGTIEGNSADKGGGVFIGFYYSTVTVSGQAVVSGNTLKDDNAVCNVYFECYDGQEASPILIKEGYTGSIGVLFEKTLKATEKRNTSTVAIGTRDHSLSENIVEHFFSDDPNYKVYFDAGSGEVRFDTKLIYPNEILVEDLTYNGSDQKNISVTGNGEQLSPEEYTYEFRSGIPHNAGVYTVDITSDKIIGGKAEGVGFEVRKADFEKTSLSAVAGYGTTAVIDLSEYIPEGGVTSTVIRDGCYEAMSGDAEINGKTLSCVLTDDKAYVGKEVKLEIAVTSCVNYRDYYLTVNLTVTDCNHPSSELRNVLKATCTDHGYSGDLCCTKCNALLEKGRETPIDPDAHDFDYSDKSDISKAPTYLSCGEHTYHCKRNHKHTIVVADIPKLPCVNVPESKTETSNKKKDVIVDLINSKGSGTVSGIYQSSEDTISSNYTVTNGKITDVNFDTSQLKEGLNRLTINTGTRIALPGMFMVSDNFATKKEYKKAKKFVSHKKSGKIYPIKWTL